MKKSVKKKFCQYIVDDIYKTLAQKQQNRRQQVKKQQK